MICSAEARGLRGRCRFVPGPWCAHWRCTRAPGAMALPLHRPDSFFPMAGSNELGGKRESGQWKERKKALSSEGESSLSFARPGESSFFLSTGPAAMPQGFLRGSLCRSAVSFGTRFPALSRLSPHAFSGHGWTFCLDLLLGLGPRFWDMARGRQPGKPCPENAWATAWKSPSGRPRACQRETETQAVTSGPEGCSATGGFTGSSAATVAGLKCCWALIAELP
jgi:hypothetical protein